jgi:anti-sigma regulatory factor (Ser/Thr protein kinase)
VGVARLAVASLARNAGLDEEAVDDLKIAVSEACTNAVEEVKGDEPISITWSDEDGGVTVEIGDRRPTSVEVDATDTQGFSTRLTMSLSLLQSLVDDFKLTKREGGGYCTRLTVRR